MPEPSSVAEQALTGTLVLGKDAPEASHVLAGYSVRPGTLLEVHLASTATEPTGQEPDWLPVHYEAASPAGPAATWLLRIDTLDGPREVDLRLPFNAVLRWPPKVQVIDLAEGDYARLATLANQLERSYDALDRVHQDARSGIPDLTRRLFRLDSAAWAGEPRLLRLWAEQRRRLSTQDLVLLEWLARDLERAVAATRRPTQVVVSEGIRSVILRESGQLLLEAGWLRDLCRRVGEPRPR
jgi:hypothetical protein